MPGAWSGSSRRARLPADWSSRRARILRRDPHCRIAGTYCTELSTEVDHVVAGDDHSDENLQGVCAPCHRVKTLRESVAARGSRKRTPPRHPGLL